MRWSSLIAAAAATMALAAPVLADPTPSTCEVNGKVVVPADTKVYDAQSGGNVIATFTGGETPIRLRSFPPKGGSGRVQVSTTRPGGYVRIDGWMALDTLKYFAAVDLPVPGAQGQVWISQSRPLRLVDASGDKLSIEYDVLGSKDVQGPQTLRALVGCRAVSIEPEPPEVADVPDRATTYTMRESVLELFDAPNGNLVFTLRLDDQARKPFWSSEQRQSFVHVLSRGDLTIDAWARRRDLDQLRRGEAFVQQVPQVTRIPARSLALEGSPAPLTVTSDLVLQAKPGDGEPAIGAVEAGAKVYAMGVSHGWTNILPAELTFMPPDGGGLWVKSTGLPKP